CKLSIVVLQCNGVRVGEKRGLRSNVGDDALTIAAHVVAEQRRACNDQRGERRREYDGNQLESNGTIEERKHRADVANSGTRKGYTSGTDRSLVKPEHYGRLRAGRNRSPERCVAVQSSTSC